MCDAKKKDIHWRITNNFHCHSWSSVICIVRPCRQKTGNIKHPSMLKQQAATLSCIVIHISLSTMSKPMAKFFGKFTDDGKIKAILDEAPYINPVGWRHSRTQASQLKEKMNEYAEHGDFNNASIFKEKKDMWLACADKEESLMKKCEWAVNFAPPKIEYHHKREEFEKCDHSSNILKIATDYLERVPDEDRCPSPTPVITVNDVPALPAEDDGQLKMGSETDVGGGSIDSPTDSNGVTAAAALLDGDFCISEV